MSWEKERDEAAEKAHASIPDTKETLALKWEYIAAWKAGANWYRKRAHKQIKALEFYAAGKHIEDCTLDGDLETPSGEPENWVCDSDGKFNLENGGIARQALASYTRDAGKGGSE